MATTKQKPTGGIYLIRNLVNARVYVGSAKDLDERKRNHFGKLEKQEHINPHLQNSYNKYGKHNFVFEVIEELIPYSVDTKTLYFERENFYIDLYRSKNLSYNIAKAEGGWTHATHARKDEIKEKISKSVQSHMDSLSDVERKEKFGKTKGKPLSSEHKRKTSEGLKGKSKSEVTKEKMRIAQSSDSAKEIQKRSGQKVGLSNRIRVYAYGKTYDSIGDALSDLKIGTHKFRKLLKDANFTEIHYV